MLSVIGYVCAGTARHANARLRSHPKLLGADEMAQWVRATGFKSPVHT